MEHTFNQRAKLLAELEEWYKEAVAMGDDLDSTEGEYGIIISANEAKIIIDIIKTWSL